MYLEKKRVMLRYAPILEAFGTYDAIHVQIKIVKFGAVWVRTRDVDRDRNTVPILIIDLSFLFFYDRTYLNRGQRGNTATAQTRTNFGIFFAEPSKQCWNTLKIQ
jgi:hypothetical protein